MATLRAARLSLSAEAALAFACGLAFFALLSAPLALADSRSLPAALLGFVGIGVVIAILRSLGIAYAVSATAAGLLAFDWFYFPPTHPHAVPRLEDLAYLMVSVAAGALIGVLAARASRRAITSERARSGLVSQQAALRRVATLVARDVSPEELFTRVCGEMERVLEVEEVDMVRLEGDGTFTVLSFGGREVGDFPVGHRLPIQGRNAISLVVDSERAARIDDYSTATGPMGEIAKSAGVRGVVGCPIAVQGRLWGVVVAASRREEPLPADTESRMGEFTDLVATAIANAQARREVASLADEQAALRRVATLVAAGAPPPEVFDAVTRELGQLLGVDSTHMGRYEPDGTAIGVGSWSVDGTLMSVGTVAPLDGTSVTGRVHESRRPERLDNYDDVPGEIAAITRGWGVNSAVGAPIVVDGELWGVMVASSRDSGPLPADTEARITQFTELVATAISNTEARTETRRLAEEQAALRRVATLVAQAVPPSELFGAVAAEVGGLLGVGRASLVRLEADDHGTAMADWAAVGEQPELRGNLPLEPGGLAATILRTGRPARIDDWETVPGALARTMGLGSSVGSPIVVEGRIWGGLFVHSMQDEPLPPDTEAHLEAFTELVATAIANTEARTETQRLTDEQAALRRVATLVAQAVPSEELFQAIAQEVGILLGTDLATLLRYEDENTATLVSFWTADGSPLEGQRTWSMTEMGLTRTLAQTDWPTRVDDWNRFSGPLAEYVRDVVGVTSSVGSPIIVEGKLWGALAVHSTQEEPVPAGAELRLGQFTELTATAIANIQARSELSASRARIIAAADDERRRVVRDLHDGAQQRLVHTVVTLKMASQASEQKPGEASSLVAEALQHAEAATEELRELAHGILPSVLTRGGLRAGVGALASRMPVPVETGVSVDRLPPAIEATAYFIVAEALTNIAKHSHASHAVVTARTGNGTLHIQVRDDGVGGARPAGPGLVGLADRVAALDGTLRLDSPADGGTLVAADIPVR